MPDYSYPALNRKICFGGWMFEKVSHTMPTLFTKHFIEFDFILLSKKWEEDEFIEQWPLCDTRENEEHPEVYAKHQHHLENALSQQRLLQVKGSVHYHGTKLDQ